MSPADTPPQPFIGEVDPHAYTAFAHASTEVADAAGFQQLIREHIRPLMPHRSLFVAIGRLHLQYLEIIKILDVDCPPGFAEKMPKLTHMRDRLPVMRIIATKQPVVVEQQTAQVELSAFGQREREEYDLGRMGLYGLLDLSSNMGSYFSFSQVSPDLDASYISRVLKLVCPLLHTAVMRIPDLQSTTQNPLENLTAIERQLLTWLAAGRSNAQMAQMRGRSPSTVRNQLEALYRKLGVASRGEAIGLALSFGLDPTLSMELPGR